MSTRSHATSGLRSKLMVVFLLGMLIPLGLMGLLAVRWNGEMANDASQSHLTSILNIKKHRLQQYLHQRHQELEMLAHGTRLVYTQRLQELEAQRDFYGEMVQHHFQELRRATELFAQNKPLPKNLVSIDWVFRQAGGTPEVLTKRAGERWRTLAAMIKPRLGHFLQQYGFDNVYMISSRGNVVLTAVPEVVLGENLKKGAFKESELGKLFAKTRNKSVFKAFTPISYLDNQQAAYIVAPIKAEKEDEIAGVLAVRFSPQIFTPLKNRLPSHEKSINLYLLDPEQLQMSLARLSAPKRAAIQSKDGVDDADKTDEMVSLLNLMEPGIAAITAVGQKEPSGTGGGVKGSGLRGGGLVKGADGKSLLLSAWGPLSIHPQKSGRSTAVVSGKAWGVVAELPIAKLFSPNVKDAMPLYKKQMDLSGYYDFLLVQPDGDVFHSATRQSDFGTNMLHGKYADTNLGRLVKRVLEKPQFAMTDIQPYPPSNHEPAAFIAQPLIHHGTLEMVVVLQLPLEALTLAMQQDDGLGDRGDAYLVGSDGRMRSDSMLDPKNHSVIASFTGEVAENGLNSAAVQAALAGETAVYHETNFANQAVLRASTPLVLAGDLTWALVVETPLVQTTFSRHTIPWMLLLAVVVTVVLSLLMVWWLASTIRRAVFQCLGLLQPLNSGKLHSATGSVLKVHNRRDEFAMLAAEIAAVISHWRTAVEKLRNSGQGTADCGMDLARLVMATPQVNVEDDCSANSTEEEVAMGEMAIHIQQQIKHAQYLQEWLGSVEQDTLQGKHAVANAVLSAREIADKTSLFVELARQTNQLSMRAAIEVASEGKYGKRFTNVIADIRKLAEQARIAADEIGELSFAAVRTVENANAILAAFAPGMHKSKSLIQTMIDTDSDQHEELLRVRGMLQQLKACIHNNTQATDQLLPVARKFSRQMQVLQEDLAFFNLGEEIIMEDVVAHESEQTTGVDV